MRIGVISDSHDNLENIRKAFAYMGKNRIEHCIHCGDICTPETLFEMGKLFSGKFHVVCGNNDSYDELAKILKLHPHIILFRDVGEITIYGKKIGWCHYPDQAESIARGNFGYDVVFYGHDHRPWQRRVGKALLLNPGTLAGLFQRPTFAVYHTDMGQAELKLIEKM